MYGTIRRTKLARWRFCAFAVEGLLSAQVANVACVAPGRAPVTVAGDVACGPAESVPARPVVEDPAPPVALATGEGEPTSVPEGKGGNVLVPATIS